MSPTHPSPFEAAVLEHIAAASADPALRAQLARVRVRARDWTGAGCYLMLQADEGAPPLSGLAGPSGRGPVPGPLFESPALEHGGGTLLWLEQGRVDCLEIYTYEEPFPEDQAELLGFRLWAEA